MVPSGATELIWHFSGYLRLPYPDIITKPTLYEGTLTTPAPPEDDAALQVTARRPPDALDMSSLPVPAPDLVSADAGPWPLMIPLHLRGVPHFNFKHFKAKVPTDPRPPSPRPGAGGGGRHDGADGDVAYRNGGDQELIDVGQTNIMHNDDVVGDFALPLPDGSAALRAMADAAASSVPDAARIDECDTTSLIAFVGTRDAAPANNPAANGPQPVVCEQHRDGAVVTDADIHQSTTTALDGAFATISTLFDHFPAASGDGSETPAQTVSLGSNIAVNDTFVIDYSGLSGTLVVLGDYFRTVSIVQTNVLYDHNWFGIAGDGANGAVADAANVVHNIADIVAQGGNGTATWHPGGAFQWSIDVLDGSFYDVKSFVLTNTLSDDDTISHVLSTGHGEFVLGSNGLVNLSDFQNLSAQYDLIIVAGSYHQASFLYQTNMVLTCNFAVLDGTGAEDGAAADTWSISSGGNALINDVSFFDLGNYSFQPVDDAILDLLRTIGNREPFDAAAVKAAFPTLVGTVNALLVTGDYYDITYVSQTNIVSDVNVATLQVDGGEQSLETGGNQAINAITVVDGGCLASPYLQGDFYNDTILVQANIVEEDDTVTFNDPAQLTAELVAFTTADDTIPDDALAFPADDLQHQQDVLAGVLH